MSWKNFPENDKILTAGMNGTQQSIEQAYYTLNRAGYNVSGYTPEYMQSKMDMMKMFYDFKLDMFSRMGYNSDGTAASAPNVFNYTFNGDYTMSSPYNLDYGQGNSFMGDPRRDYLRRSRFMNRNYYNDPALLDYQYDNYDYARFYEDQS